MNFPRLGCMLLAGGLASAAGAARIVYDFESGDLQGWQITRGAFACIVSDRAKEFYTDKPYTKGGTYFLTTLEDAQHRSTDAQTGWVESPLVKLASPRITFKIGGGSHDNVFQLIDRRTGEVYAQATGRDVQTMFPTEWNVPKAVGREVFFRVVDEGTGGWCHLTLDDVVCEGEVVADDFARRAKEMGPKVPSVRYEQAAAAVKALGEQFPDYPAAKYLAELADLQRTGASPDAFAPRLVEMLVTANPIVNAHEIVYVTRATFRGDHHNTATIFQCGEINEGSYATQGALKAYDPKTGKVRILVPEAEGRTVRDPEVDWDGSRIVFSMRTGRADDYHIYMINADGSQPRQLTAAKGVSDIDPAFLPDGDIVFGSTREPKYCMCNRHIMANLFRMKPDGANIHQIGKSTLFEGHASVLPDGRVLYDRWEYVDRNFGDAQGLWVCNPDGTRHAIYWGNNTSSPGGVVNARPLSNPSQVIAVLGSCHDRPWGALGIIDRSRGVDGREPVLRTWPAEYRDRIHTSELQSFDLRDYINGNEGSVRQDFDSTTGLRRKYADPFPLDDAHFLCVRQTGHGEETALVYLDLFGNEVEFLREAPGVHSPVVLRASKRPPALETQRTFAAPNAPGRFYVQNVYIGTHMKGVEKGSIKALRIVESPEKRSWIHTSGWGGHGEQAACMNWHSFENKRVLGTVPVEADGSAYFEVPANTFVYFQALDKDGRMVQSMRSGAYLQPGELYGCVGCHEDRVGDVPKVEAKPLAMQRAPSKLDGAYNLAGLEKGTPPHLYSYQREVQPVFTRRCASCHNPEKPAGAKLDLTGDRGAFFCASYVDLWARGYLRCAGGGPAETLPAYSWGAHASALTKKLNPNHGRSGITPEEIARVVTWMDLNAPYWPCYEVAWPGNVGGRMPLTPAEFHQLQQLTGVSVATSSKDRRKQREQLNFDQPAKSRILAPVKGKPAYDAARTILEKGKARLAETPRADMDGFVPCAADRAREERYQRRLAEETAVYEAIRAGQKRYDAN